jgi:TPP-dependent pyruvate/acetoin dehydrogenase alpha subunit
MRYVPKELLEEWARKDPIERQERRLAVLGVDVAAVREEVERVVEAATEEALAMPAPDPASATEDVFADEAVPLGDGAAPWSGFSQLREVA